MGNLFAEKVSDSDTIENDTTDFIWEEEDSDNSIPDESEDLSEPENTQPTPKPVEEKKKKAGNSTR